MDETFNYCIARLWDTSNPNHLCIYAFGTETLVGTMKDAKHMLDYVNGKNPSKSYSIYKVTYTKVE